MCWTSPSAALRKGLIEEAPAPTRINVSCPMPLGVSPTGTAVYSVPSYKAIGPFLNATEVANGLETHTKVLPPRRIGMTCLSHLFWVLRILRDPNSPVARSEDPCAMTRFNDVGKAWGCYCAHEILLACIYDGSRGSTQHIRLVSDVDLNFLQQSASSECTIGPPLSSSIAGTYVFRICDIMDEDRVDYLPNANFLLGLRFA
jgi:hypothetical protein